MAEHPTSFTRRGFLLGAGAGLVGLGLGEHGAWAAGIAEETAKEGTDLASAAGSRPNILLINCDDLGYGDLGCYGSDVNATPAIDRLASEGMRFTDFYVSSAVCSPSRGSLLTGCYPARIGFSRFEGKAVLFPGMPVGLNPQEVTFAKLLKEQGYATKLVGKWHCGDQPEFLPTRHGFDSYYGLPYSNDMGIQVGRTKNPPLPLMDGESVLEQQPDQRSLTERYVEQCVRFMREKREGPFLLYLAHMHTHRPNYTNQRFMEESTNGRYGAAVRELNWATDALMRELDSLGIAENTLVIFTSDNGSYAQGEGGSNAPLRGHKHESWEGGFRVPCIMRWPGVIPAGSECSEVATAMDFLPTFATVAGTKAPGDRTIDGHDVLPLMRGEAGAKSPYDAFLYYQGPTPVAVRVGQWKLFIWQGSNRMQELYDLASDVGETTNVAEQHPEVVAQLEAAIDPYREELGDRAMSVEGRNVRPIGRVDDPKTLTQFDPSHPYIIAEYDLPDVG